MDLARSQWYLFPIFKWGYEMSWVRTSALVLAISVTMWGCGGAYSATGNGGTTITKKSGSTTSKKKSTTTTTTTTGGTTKTTPPATPPKVTPPPVKRLTGTATLKADHGVLFSDASVVKDGSGLKVDLVAYKHGTGLDLKSGRVGTDNQPLHKFGSKKFASLSEVPCDAPSSAERGGYFQLPPTGAGFTLTGNKTAGTFKVWVKSSTGPSVVIQYEKCN